MSLRAKRGNLQPKPKPQKSTRNTKNLNNLRKTVDFLEKFGKIRFF
jgi:hypothetical protein